MKKTKINFSSWPAQLYDFTKDKENEKFTRCKLKVFYEGETADHRLFSAAFAAEMKKSLPYTPVVGFYDEEQEDFVGHATEQQIYGMVDPCAEITDYVDPDDGNKWCVCDVVLYTERPDKVGDIAQKIVGHKQSLEIDPKTVKYTINYDSRKHFKNIEFTAGSFIGLSVLGDSEKPAFTGSEFFSLNEDLISSKMKEKLDILSKYCADRHYEKLGGTKDNMNYTEFVKLSWGELSEKISLAFAKEYSEAYTYMIDMYDDNAIFRVYYYNSGESKLLRAFFNKEDNDLTFSKVEEVHVVYEPIEAAANETFATDINGQVETNATITTDTESIVQEEKAAVTIPSVDDDATFAKDDEEKDKSNCASSEEDKEKDKSNCASSEEKDNKQGGEGEEPKPKDEENFNGQNDGNNTNSMENVGTKGEITDHEDHSNKEGATSDDAAVSESNSSSAAFTDSERAEFEALKREKKVNLINSYKEFLSEEEYKTFVDSVDSYADNDKLEFDLLKKFKAYSDEHAADSKSNSSSIIPFAFTNVNNEKSSAEKSLTNYVNGLLGR